ncbi:hypothetical protein CTI12_AA064310 [Artemisia annua]|uniref:DNA topoisomerase (ATP-hydrolyzing) n=1 Tax=Artemisia annua TaxID=35608 RepID=A0A2U1PTC6_ARTAN|nr:hypothetical protein CTI12_AA064310 [Artemisia annua]
MSTDVSTTNKNEVSVENLIDAKYAGASQSKDSLLASYLEAQNTRGVKRKKNEGSMIYTHTSRMNKNEVSVENLIDAKYAGASQSKDCTLIVVGGQSAKNFAIGLATALGLDTHGVYTMQGKLMNPRGVAVDKWERDTQIQNIMESLGLQFDKDYESREELRYGHFLITPVVTETHWVKKDEVRRFY